MTEVVIYGLGVYGKNIADKLIQNRERMGIKIVALMDKNIRGYHGSFYVKKPDELGKMPYDAIIITSEKWYAQIKKELIEVWNVNPPKVFSLSEFMSEKFMNEDIEGEIYCNLCMKKAPFGIMAGIENDIFHKKKIVGGGRRENAICPFCGSSDRERFVEWVLENKTDIYQKDGQILHFAPEKNIERKLRRYAGYRTADIQPIADEIQDITNIEHGNDYFDFIILNHVMEHIAGEREAFSELKRCIKPEGKIVLTVPICWETPTLEDVTVTTDEGRLEAYGQKDHVRLYGNDMENRLESMGFRVTMYKVKEDVPKEEAESMNLIEEDTVWVLEK